ncbi:MAG: LysM peptidoglycan-binding domain-containing protein [Elusimicrobiota bacterium]
MRRLLPLALLLVALGTSAAAEGPDTESSFQSIVVRPGDTLWAVSRKYLNDPARWDEILKHNRLPTSDPTVALPGMTLRVPVRLIKSQFRAAYLVYRINRVLHRRKETADWKPSKGGMELYQGDSLRTYEDSKARVKLLNKELLSLEQNSMAVIKPFDRDTDLELKSGSVFAGRARVITASARITPRSVDTRYSASVEPDLATKVEVYAGVADVEAQGSSVEVSAGMATRVMPGLSPEVPKPAENLPVLEARAQEFASAREVGGGAAPNPRMMLVAPEPEADAESLRGDIQSLHVGIPILGFHMQAARDREFKQVLFDRRYDSDERFSPADAGLSPGAYWWRIAAIDLLGAEEGYSAPRYYTVGIKRAEHATTELARELTLVSPLEGAVVTADIARVVGVLRNDRLRIEIADKPVRIDADGSFTANVPLVQGLNEIVVVVSDGQGNVTRISRRVTH